MFRENLFAALAHRLGWAAGGLLLRMGKWALIFGALGLFVANLPTPDRAQQAQQTKPATAQTGKAQPVKPATKP